jgi:hypothetical protein
MYANDSGAITGSPISYTGDTVCPKTAITALTGTCTVPLTTENIPGGGIAVVNNEVYSLTSGRGIARAVGQVNGVTGTFSKSFGIVSVTKNGTGAYVITHNLSNPLVIVSLLSTGATAYDVSVNSASNETTVWILSPSGVATDRSFNIVIF